MAIPMAYIAQFCCAMNYCYGNNPGNDTEIQHRCRQFEGKVHPWCMGKEDMASESLADGSICCKCNNGQYSEMAIAMQPNVIL